MSRRKIALKEGEMAQLIRASQPHGSLQFSFGPSGVWLDPNDAPWAEKLLGEWRGETLDQGAGI